MKQQKKNTRDAFKDAALVVVDIQTYHASAAIGLGNEETEKVAGRIKRLAPAFRKAGLPIFAVYWWSDENPDHPIDFHKFIPKPDEIVTKRTQSAFDSSDLHSRLKAKNIRTLYICGVNEHACVGATVLDALEKGYEVHVVQDLTGIGKAVYDREDKRAKARKQMVSEGAIYNKSSELLPKARPKTP